MSNLFTLKIATQRGQTIGFLYDDEAQCKRNYDEVRWRMPGNSISEDRGLDSPTSQCVTIADSVGNIATIDCANVAMVWFTNVGKELEGQKDMALLQAHANANLNRKVAADPLLRQAAPPGGIPDLSQFKRN